MSASAAFFLLRSADKKPKWRIFELLRGQGMQANQQLPCFSGDADTVRRLPEYLHPAAEHILDWCHLTMRITVLQQCARGLPGQTTKSMRDPADAESAGEESLERAAEAEEESLERQLESVKHYLWPGASRKAWARLGWIAEDLESWNYGADGEPKPQPGSEGSRADAQISAGLETYISNNAGSIVNYGARYRHGERISTGFVGSTINQVISQRMVKKRQMQ